MVPEWLAQYGSKEQGDQSILPLLCEVIGFQ
jgi:hypothetical protein